MYPNSQNVTGGGRAIPYRAIPPPKLHTHKSKSMHMPAVRPQASKQESLASTGTQGGPHDRIVRVRAPSVRRRALTFSDIVDFVSTVRPGQPREGGRDTAPADKHYSTQYISLSVWVRGTSEYHIGWRA